MTHINHKVEVRTCVKCGETKEIPQKHKHATNVCIECQRAASRHYQKMESIREGRRVGFTGRVPYPLEEPFTTTGNYFKSMASKTFKCKTREEWRELMRNRLLNLSEDVLKWINAHDSDEPKKKQKKIETDYPDTRYMTWDEYERGLGDNEVDS
jgi:hypothetical protein